MKPIEGLDYIGGHDHTLGNKAFNMEKFMCPKVYYAIGIIVIVML